MADSKYVSYKQAGVDIKQADQLVADIKDFAAKTRRPELLAGIGGFGSAFELPSGYKSPVIVSSTDGVGTKLKVAQRFAVHSTIGIDLVAMCVNDLLCMGAEPLFFLDYYATSKLDPSVAASVISGIADACLQSNMTLAGGETAEMPGMYADGDYDLAGFCVGVVEKARLTAANPVLAGDVLIALPSSGVHSNGYALVNNLLERNLLPEQISGLRLQDVLLRPTKIYTAELRQLERTLTPHALAHITGGGLADNIMRVIPPDLGIELNSAAWQWPEIFKVLQAAGPITTDEMRQTFNLGVGMALVVAEADSARVLDLLGDSGAFIFGRVIANRTVNWR